MRRCRGRIRGILRGLAAGLVLVLAPEAGAQGAAGADPSEREAAARFLAELDPLEQKVAPFRVFDDLYYVGIGWVSAWLLTTDAGHVLIDTTYGEYADHVVDGVRKLGFDPADIVTVLCTHAHFDHLGGAATVRAASGARVGMTKADWEMLESGEALRHADFEPVARDLVIEDGDVLELGGAKLEFYVTPGHTPGVLSVAFTVHDGGRPHRAFTFGGVGLNFEGVDRTELYLASVERLLGMEGIEVNVPNHPMMGDVFERAKRLEVREPGDAHPFVAPEAWREWLLELRVGGREKLEREKASAAGDG